MTDSAIHVQSLGKKYRIGALQQRQNTLRDQLMAGMRDLYSSFRFPGTPKNAQRNEMWALDNVSFEIMPGEVVGVIGRNGAGKSTLLKLLAHITTPTVGKIEIRGRVGSLLEVGTGFSQELTGRENIYLNGAILGMKKNEIERKFDEIVAFAEIEKFLDTPVKHYSSGMYMRLAFAVAAHLEPEILLVDEVLAVGDLAFQNKCLGKMGEVAHQGRTVLLVSHNMIAVRSLCQKAIWLDHGVIKQMGKAGEVIDAYTSSVMDRSAGSFDQLSIQGDGTVNLISYSVRNAHGDAVPLPSTNEDVLICVQLEMKTPIQQPAVGISIYNDRGVLLTSLNTVEKGIIFPPLGKGKADLLIKLKHVAYIPGNYYANFWVMNPQGHLFAYAIEQIHFELGQKALYGTSEIDHRWGSVYTDIDFSLGT
jgi:lipopolysaccharide transport system ATP-binding protein